MVLPSSFFVDEPFFRVLESKMGVHSPPGIIIQVHPVDSYYTDSFGHQVVSLKIGFLYGVDMPNCVKVI